MGGAQSSPPHHTGQVSIPVLGNLQVRHRVDEGCSLLSLEDDGAYTAVLTAAVSARSKTYLIVCIQDVSHRLTREKTKNMCLLRSRDN